jgi:hypothetical protein
MASMSTPISKIPLNQNVPIQAESHEDDPEVQAVLQEVQQPILPVKVQAYAPPPQMINPQQIYQMSQSIPLHNGATSFIQTDIAKRAMVAAIIATIIFYPQTLQMVYEKIPVLGKFSSYDSVIRTALLALVLYILMWKLNL